MKHIYQILLLIVVVAFGSAKVQATHLMGGEITWECTPSGEFIFHMKLYQDCNGNHLLGADEVIEVYNHPTITQIPAKFITSNDISPSCGGTGPNITCDGATGSTPGAVEEFIYTSDPILLSGVPPSQGWAFTWDNCCRNGAIDNLQDPDTYGMTIRAIMYPFNGQNMFPCFDSSPDFAATPTAVVCAGSDFTYNHNASDRDKDSVAYHWGLPLSDFTGVFNPTANPTDVPFQAPYTLNNPLPGSPVLNSSTGEVAFNASILGSFVTVVKVESWRCGELIAEVYREIQMVITNCAANSPPQVEILDMAGNPIAYADTVHVGDVVTFQLKGVDVGQTVSLSSNSNQYGTNFANPNSGCVNPPCAVLAPPPITGSITQNDSLTVYFNWETDCNHISYSDVCATSSNTYTFVFNIQDDFCPAAGKSIATVALTVLAMPVIPPPALHCVDVDNGTGDVELSWELPPDTANTFNSYHVYYATNQNGPYTVIDSIFNYNQQTYTHVGSNAHQQKGYYYLRSRSGCLGQVLTTQSDTLSTIFLNTSFNPATAFVTLNWNSIHDPLLSSSNTWYKVYKEFPQGNWDLIDSTQALTYNDSTTTCSDSLTYYVSINDNMPCLSSSNASGIAYVNTPPIADFTSTIACRNDTTFFTDASTSAVHTINDWTWYFGTDTAHGNTTGYIYEITDALNASLVVTTENGCSDSINKAISINELPTPNAGADDEICVFDTTQLNAPGGLINHWWTSEENLSDSTILNPDVYPTSTTDFILAGEDANGCIGFDSVQVVVHGLPNPILASYEQFCEGDSVQVEANGGDFYTWNTETNLSDSTVNNPYIATPDTGWFFVTITDLNGCSNTDSIVVYRNPLPIANAGSNIQICINDSVQIGGSPTGPTGSTYLWDNNTSLSYDSLANPWANPTDTIQYTVVVTDTNGCTAIDSMIVTVNPLPIVDAGLDRQICIGDSTLLVATGGDAYSWSPLFNNLTPTDDTTIIHPTDTTQYFVLVTDSNGCQQTDSVLITVNPLPIVDAGLNREICIYDTTLLVATGGENYNWIPVDSLLSPTNDSTLAFPTDTTTYFVEVTDSNACINLDSVTIVVNPLPTVDAGLSRQICINDSTLLVATGGENYVWSPTTSLNQPNNDSTWASPIDTSQYNVMVTDSNGCVNYDSLTITVNPLPIVDAGLNREICIGDTTLLIATGGEGYSWTPLVNSLTPVDDSTLVYPTDTTQYFVLVTDSNGCQQSDSVLVTVNPLPVIDAGINRQICIYDTTLLVAVGGEDYLWSPNTALSSNIIDSSLAFPVDTTTYTVQVTDSNGCVQFDSVLITVNPLPIVDAGLDVTICIYDSVSIGGVPTGPSLSTYEWNNAQFLNDSTLSNPNASPDDTTSFIVIVTDTNSCINTDTTIVNVNPLPIVDAGLNREICIYDTTLLVSTGGVNYSWSPLINNISPNNDSTLVHPTDTTTYFVLVTDTNGCQEIDSVIITVNPLPIVDAGLNREICIYDSTLLVATGGVSYNWNPTDSLLTPNNDSTFAFPTDTSDYFVEVTDTNGCINYDSLTITVNPLPIVDAGLNREICINDSTLLLATGGEFYAWSPAPTLADSSNNTTWATPIDTTQYLVEVIDSNGCANNDSVLITVNPLPVVDAGSNTQICIGDSALLIASGGEQYTWSPINSLSSPNNDSTLAWPSDTTTYFVEVVDSNACINHDSVIVTVNPLPNANAGNNRYVCPSDTIQLQASGGVDYFWFVADSINNVNIANPLIWPGDTFVYHVEVTDSNGCVLTDSLRVDVNPIVPTNAGNDTAICVFDSIMIGGSPTGPLGTTYSWNTSQSLSDSTASNPIVSPQGSTWYFVYTTNHICNGVDSVYIKVNQLPVVDAGLNREICIGDTTMLVATGGETYSWNPGTTLSDSLNDSTLANPLDTTQYFVLVTDSNSCSNTDSVVIIVNPLPAIDAGLNREICIYDSTLLIATGGDQYSWTPIDSLLSPNNDSTWAYPLDTTQYFVEVIDSNGCINWDSVVVTVNPLPIFDAGLNREICIGDSTTLAATGGELYGWSPTDSLLTPNQSTTSAFPTDTTIYYVLVTDSNSCLNTDSVVITVNPLPVVSAGINQQICIGDSAMLIATGGDQYNWSPSISLLTHNNDSTIAVPQDTTHYIVLVTDTNNCINTDTTIVIVNPLPVVDAGNDTTGCIAGLYPLGGMPSGPTGSTFNWTGENIDAATLANPKAVVNEPSSYFVIVTDTNGCINSDSMSVDVFRVSGSSDTTICERSSVEVMAIPTSGYSPYSYQWSPSSNIQPANEQNVTISPVGLNEVLATVTVTDSIGCIDTHELTVSLYNTPEPSFDISLTPSCDSITLHYSNSTVDGELYFWNFQGTHSSTLENNQFNYPYNSTINTFLIAENEYCLDTSFYQLDLTNMDAYINLNFTKAFSPNSDNVNDYFTLIQPTNDLESCSQLTIYNRWGNIVYTTQTGTSWDGNDTQGQEAPAGVYFYTYQVGTISKQGSVTLFR